MASSEQAGRRRAARWLALPAALAAAASSAPAGASPLPEPVREMILAAGRGTDAARADAVIAVARQTNPDSSAEIDALVRQLAVERAHRDERKKMAAGLLDLWHGSGELGGSVSTGNSDTTTLAVGLNLTREGIDWRHHVDALADLQRSDGVNAQERYVFNYQGDWRAGERFYLLGRVGWERNQQAGLRSRFIEAVGLGYHMVEGQPISWDLEAGPSLRQSQFYDRTDNGAALRLASNFSWELGPAAQFSQNTSFMLEEGNSSILTVTSITSRLWGPISARLSVNTQFESNPPEDRVRFDAITRATLVYEFGRK
jgi:putative salt-induced outer membrane protein